MAEQIHITSTVPDSRASQLLKSLRSQGYTIDSVRIVDTYTFDKKFTHKELAAITEFLVNPVSQQAIVMIGTPFNYALEIGFLPGVTDNIAATVKELTQERLGKPFKNGENVYSSQIIFLLGKLTQKQVEEIGAGMANKLIRRVSVKTEKAYKKDRGMDVVVPRVKLTAKGRADLVNLNVTDEKLAEIGKKGVPNRDGTFRGPLALSIEYMKAIQQHFNKLKRKPTDIELESIAQTWSEHCKHTIFADPMDEIKKGLFKTYIKGATEEIRKNAKKDICVSVFTDNSGGIAFDDQYIVTHKGETHNSPSALDPFGGAITGIVGVNRDALGFGLGAKPIANTYGYCFADPSDDSPLYKGDNKTQRMLSPKQIMEGVIAGVNAGGNQSGIPTPAGFMYFDKRYKGKPLVFVGTVGLIPRKIKGRKSYVKKAEAGDYIVMIGGRVGLDGIHGATFSSEAMDAGSPATAVQIGDPITQKKFSDTIVKEARELNLYRSITDNGAGGISCSVAEMAKESGGCKVDLEKVPVKYPGLAPWQIWISESQERMTLAVPKSKWHAFQTLMKKRGVEATVIGTFTKSGKCVVTYNKKTVMNLDMEFLHNGLPERQLMTLYTPPIHDDAKFAAPRDLTKPLLTLIARPNIASFDFITNQYDYEVQGLTVLKPLQGRGRVNAETAVLRPRLDSKKGVSLSHALYPTYSDIDTYHMAAAAIDTAIRNLVIAGASLDQIALLDNFCWCSPDEPFRLGQLKRAVQACYDLAVGYGTPYISGKDSMYNDFKGYDDTGKQIHVAIPPTLIVSSIGIINNINTVVSMDPKQAGDYVYVLGETFDELGASEYFAMNDVIGNKVPTVDIIKNKRIYQAFAKAIQKGLVASAASVTHGGLGATFAKMAIAGQLGLDISLNKLPGKTTRADYALFSESQGRIVATVDPKKAQAFETIMKETDFARIGKVTKENFKITDAVDTTIDKLAKAYRSTFKDF